MSAAAKEAYKFEQEMKMREEFRARIIKHKNEWLKDPWGNDSKVFLHKLLQENKSHEKTIKTIFKEVFGA